MSAGSSAPEVARRQLAIKFILLFGVVSALGDFTYEGARSVYGIYLSYLGAGAAVIGLVTGLGEFLGYFLRLLSGYLADRTGYYWPIAIAGYAMLLSVPLLALAGNWQLAALFIILERVGKAVRSPAKDALLSHATRQLGSGLGFGLHEALDQVGALIGPLLFTLALAGAGGYRAGFHRLWLPAVLTLLVLLYTRRQVPEPVRLEQGAKESIREAAAAKGALPAVFRPYALFTLVSVLGFISFPLLSFHFVSRQIWPAAAIPSLYALAMLVDGLLAVPIGRWYDRQGLKVLLLVPLLSLLVAICGLMQQRWLVVVAAVLWGIVMSMHETIMRAALADMTPAGARGRAYGIFNTLYGLAMLLGGAVVGWLYQHTAPGYVLGLVFLCQAAAMVLLGRLLQLGWGRPAGGGRYPLLLVWLTILRLWSALCLYAHTLGIYNGQGQEHQQGQSGGV
ncbi:MAG: MFS transporter [Desulfurispora sp.]|uniref:MFS transporter n=1 Tax=Desulfurispora sp. TaxID=3014275 RepID=UPI004049A187